MRMATQIHKYGRCGTFFIQQINVLVVLNMMAFVPQDKQHVSEWHQFRSTGKTSFSNNHNIVRYVVVDLKPTRKNMTFVRCRSSKPDMIGLRLTLE